jgi:hypothetical protein
MAINSQMDDFLGFSFDGIHCSRLGITRVSDGDRYTESLMPDFEDKIITVPGKDGSYYFGSSYSNKPISISFGFDSMTEVQFRQMGKLFGTKKICTLVFDERPYKIYMAKISAPLQLNYICFDEPKKITTAREGIRVIDRSNGNFQREEVTPYIYTGEKERIYKGEGTIEFTSVSPYAHEQFKILDAYGNFDYYDRWGVRYRNNPRSVGELEQRLSEEGHSQDTNAPENIIVGLGNSLTEYQNVEEWGAASGLLSYELYKKNNIDVPIATQESGYNIVIPLYNPGDIDTPFYLFLPYEQEENNNIGKLEPNSGDWVDINMSNNVLRLKPFTAKANLQTENGIMINTQNHLIEGVLYDMETSSWKTTGNLYNEFITAGDFSKIKSADWSMYNTWSRATAQAIYLNCTTAANARIHYNYLYY